jgi:hypothetical protein
LDRKNIQKKLKPPFQTEGLVPANSFRPLDMTENLDYNGQNSQTLKILLLGASQVGKSAFIQRYVEYVTLYICEHACDIFYDTYFLCSGVSWVIFNPSTFKLLALTCLLKQFLALMGKCAIGTFF